MDILGDFKAASGNKKYLVIAIDYFTKWVEAKPLAKITEAKMKKFIHDKVIYRFEVPKILVSDNGKQFDNPKFRAFCQSYNIDYQPIPVAYPQANGQVEVTNRTLLEGVTKRLKGAKGKWVEELPSVLWAYWSTVRTPTGESPFCLAYGMEALAPVEVLAMSHRVLHFNERTYVDGLQANLDFIDEVWEKALLRNVAYQQRTAKYYNTRVRERLFHQGDLVRRRASASQPRKEVVGHIPPMDSAQLRTKTIADRRRKNVAKKRRGESSKAQKGKDAQEAIQRHRETQKKLTAAEAEVKGFKVEVTRQKEKVKALQAQLEKAKEAGRADLLAEIKAAYPNLNLSRFGDDATTVAKELGDEDGIEVTQALLIEDPTQANPLALGTEP
ncbi:uncharacterized protein K02A2.6-like [Telopea speciosissima]|uniref:uncharacterized protein K02A2.6-like n=1 Tax=Telopea speciosissima TaxID=54955 RepID=UPI001CC5D70B|nr:uncharacterized protein K02A2.6-like [Telopea speciosissima]